MARELSVYHGELERLALNAKTLEELQRLQGMREGSRVLASRMGLSKGEL